ncbi:MAG: hypothetical protein ACTHLH_08375 [Solirubrobacterales bacterium]
MTRARRLIPLAALALVLAAPALVQASSASAQPKYRFETRSANGYRIFVTARGSTLVLGVMRNERARRAGTATYYLTRVGTHGGRITARIGSLGSVSMTFHPTGAERVEQSNCNSSMTLSRPGTFIGSLHFLGEGGYVTLSAHRLQGVELRPGPECNLSAANRIEAKGKIDRLYANFRTGLDATYFYARTLASGGSLYEVEADMGGSEYAVQRYAYVYAPAGTFATDDSLSFANVTPPYPFSGTGSLQRAADGAPTWTGSLAVSFPGASDVPLTGPPFRALLTRSW